MGNALNNALSRRNLDIVWRFEKSRLLKSCFGIDRQTGQRFQEQLSYEFHRLRERALNGFSASGLLAIAKPKPDGGNRIICVPTISDRVLQFALLAEFRVSLEKRGLLNPISFGLIRSAIALRTLRGWVYKADIEKFFDNIPREAVRKAVTKIVPQRSIHKAILPFIDAEIQDGFDPDWKQIVAKAGIVEGKGVRQGMPLSPYFAGMILRDLDTALQKRGVSAIRYVDDIVAFFSSRKECETFHAALQELLGEIGLSIGVLGGANSKTRIYEPDKPADFLGMEIFPTGDAKYNLRISDACIQKIGAKFAGLGDIDTLLQRKVTLPRLGGFLDAMESGYLQAYDSAQNHALLVAEVRQMKAAALGATLEQALGEQVARLGRRERRFLGIE